MKRILAAVTAIGVASSAAARADEIPLPMSTFSAPNAAIEVQHFAPWAKAVNEQAQGTIRVELRAGTSIANPLNAHHRPTKHHGEALSRGTAVYEKLVAAYAEVKAGR